MITCSPKPFAHPVDTPTGVYHFGVERCVHGCISITAAYSQDVCMQCQNNVYNLPANTGTITY